jgi:hypothetical protein
VDVVRCRSCLELASFKPAPFTVRTVQTIRGGCIARCELISELEKE